MSSTIRRDALLNQSPLPIPGQPNFDQAIPKQGLANFQLGTNGNVATRMVDGRCATIVDNTPGYTWELVVTLAEEADAVRWIFGQSRAGGVASGAPNMAASMYAPTSFADADASNFTTPVAVGGVTAGWVFPAPTVDATMAYQLSDWQSLSTVPRSDGGKYPMVGCRAWLLTTSRLCLMGADVGGSGTYDSWAARPVTERQMRIRRATSGGNQAGGGAFVGALASSCPIIGLQYQARGKVYTIGGWGDSNLPGRGPNIGEGWLMLLAEKINADNLGFKVETMQRGWSSATSNMWSANIKIDFAAGLIPDLVCYQEVTPNDCLTPNWVTAAILATTRQRFALRMGDTLVNKTCKVALINFGPSNTAAKQYALTDPVRLTGNAAMDATGLPVIDVSTPMSGAVDGTGQVQILPQYSDDGLHWNLAGQNRIADYNKQKVINLLAYK